MDDAREDAMVGDDGSRLPPKVRQVIESRKVWAGMMGLVMTLALWALGEVDGASAVEALTWVVGIFIGAVALEDGMTRLFSTLVGVPEAAPEITPEKSRQGDRGQA